MYWTLHARETETEDYLSLNPHVSPQAADDSMLSYLDRPVRHFLVRNITFINPSRQLQEKRPGSAKKQ